MNRPERKATVTIVLSDGDMSVFGLPEGATVEVIDYDWGENDVAHAASTNTEPPDHLEYDALDGAAFVRYEPHTAPDFPPATEATS
jgi:hypothetical protein